MVWWWNSYSGNMFTITVLKRLLPSSWVFSLSCPKTPISAANNLSDQSHAMLKILANKSNFRDEQVILRLKKKEKKKTLFKRWKHHSIIFIIHLLNVPKKIWHLLNSCIFFQYLFTASLSIIIRMNVRFDVFVNILWIFAMHFYSKNHLGRIFIVKTICNTPLL